MLCPNCKKECRDGAKFCAYCGYSFPDVESEQKSRQEITKKKRKKSLMILAVIIFVRFLMEFIPLLLQESGDTENVPQEIGEESADTGRQTELLDGVKTESDDNSASVQIKKANESVSLSDLTGRWSLDAEKTRQNNTCDAQIYLLYFQTEAIAEGYEVPETSLLIDNDGDYYVSLSDWGTSGKCQQIDGIWTLEHLTYNHNEKASAMLLPCDTEEDGDGKYLKMDITGLDENVIGASVNDFSYYLYWKYEGDGGADLSAQIEGAGANADLEGIWILDEEKSTQENGETPDEVFGEQNYFRIYFDCGKTASLRYPYYGDGELNYSEGYYTFQKYDDAVYLENAYQDEIPFTVESNEQNTWLTANALELPEGEQYYKLYFKKAELTDDFQAACDRMDSRELINRNVLKSSFKEETGMDYLYYLYDDYDGDGTGEAIFLTGTFSMEDHVQDNVEIYFMKEEGECTKLSGTYLLSGDPQILESDGKKILLLNQYDEDFFAWSYLFGVHNGEIYMLDISGKYADFAQTDEPNVFTANEMIHPYGDFEVTEHTFAFDANEGQFYEQ